MNLFISLKLKFSCISVTKCYDTIHVGIAVVLATQYAVNSASRAFKQQNSLLNLFPSDSRTTVQCRQTPNNPIRHPVTDLN